MRETLSGESQATKCHPEEEIPSGILFSVGFCAVMYLWTKGGVEWWERTVDPLLPPGFHILSVLIQLGIGGLAFMSAATVAFSLSDLRQTLVKWRNYYH